MALDNFRTIELIWDKANKSIIKTIKTASSDTTGRYLSVKILDGGQEVTLNNAKLQLYWEHPNFNTSGTDDFNTVNNGGLFSLTFSDEMLTNIGELNAHLVLTLTDGKITSGGFPIEVIKGSSSSVVIPSNGDSAAIKAVYDAMEKLNNFDGGPSIFMNTLSELQTTYPNGAAGVALVRETDPARIYVWNGTTWEDFGAYQGLKIKDRSVDRHALTESLEQAITLPQIDLPNLVKNGNFSNGTDGWFTSPTTPIRTGQNRLMIDMTSETIRSNFGVFQNVPEFKNGRTYYFSVRMTLPKTTNILQFIKVVNTPYISVTGNESVFISNIIEVDNPSDTLNRVQLGINTSEFSVGDTIIIQDVNVFDITDYESLDKTTIDEVASKGHLSTYYINEAPNVPQLVGTIGDGVIKPRPISEYPISVSNDSVSIEKFTPDLRSVLTLPQIAMTNVTLNGDFSEGDTSWYLNNNGATHEIIDNEVIVTVTEESIRGNLPIYQVNNNLKTNTKYYMSVEILPDVSTTAVLSLKTKSTGYRDISSSDWNFISEIIEVDTAESALNRIYVYFNTLNFSPGQNIRIKNVTVIELDDDEKNKLSKEDLDLTVKSNDYIKNTQLVTINNGNKNIIGSTGTSLKPMPSTVFTSHLHGKTSVHMGDSITGNAFEHDYPSYVGERTGLKVYNVGFGGSRAGKHTENYDRFSFYRLANCIAQNDYSSLHLPFPDQPWTYPARIEILENIDWNEVDILTLAYGANDWRANSPVDLENLRDENSFKGALRSGIEAILQAYPHLQIIIMSPFYRFNTSEGWDSDDEIINYGNTGIMKDYWVASKEIATEFKFPHFDAYYSLGINALNKSQYFTEPDGTHHIEKGRELIGHKLASFMLSNL